MLLRAVATASILVVLVGQAIVLTIGLELVVDVLLANVVVSFRQPTYRIPHKLHYSDKGLTRRYAAAASLEIVRPHWVPSRGHKSFYAVFRDVSCVLC